MTPQSPRSYTKLAIAIVIGAVIVSTAILASSTFRTVVTTTSTAVSTSTSTVTATTISSTTSTLITTETVTPNSTISTIYYSTSSSSDTFFTSSCSITGIAGLQFRIVSDSSGTPVNVTTITAVDRLGCDSEQQVVYLNTFSVTQGGWMTPVFPSQAQPGGQLNFTITYQGKAYNFSAGVAPVGTACVTLHVPSGNVTTQSVMSQQCS